MGHFEIFNALVERGPEKHAHFRVMATLLRYTNRDSSHTTVSNDKVKECAGVSDSTFRRALRDLKQAGWITRDERDGETCITYLHVPTPVHSEPPLKMNGGTTMTPPQNEPPLTKDGGVMVNGGGGFIVNGGGVFTMNPLKEERKEKRKEEEEAREHEADSRAGCTSASTPPVAESISDRNDPPPIEDLTDHASPTLGSRISDVFESVGKGRLRQIDEDAILDAFRGLTDDEEMIYRCVRDKVADLTGREGRAPARYQIVKFVAQDAAALVKAAKAQAPTPEAKPVRSMRPGRFTHAEMDARYGFDYGYKDRPVDLGKSMARWMVDIMGALLSGAPGEYDAGCFEDMKTGLPEEFYDETTELYRLDIIKWGLLEVSLYYGREDFEQLDALRLWEVVEIARNEKEAGAGWYELPTPA